MLVDAIARQAPYTARGEMFKFAPRDARKGVAGARVRVVVEKHDTPSPALVEGATSA